MSNRESEINENLAVNHMRRVCRAAMQHRSAPTRALKEDYLRTATVEARVLRTLADNSGDKTLTWAANEANTVVDWMKAS